MGDQISPSGERAGREVSVVLPVYEEEDTIRELIAEIVRILDGVGLDFEIVAVEDGSSDGTLEALRGCLPEFAGVLRVVRHLKNRGNGASLRTGIHAATGEIVVTMDADGQHHPKWIPQLLEQMPPYDLVVGARTSDYQGPRLRGLANQFYNRFSSWLAQRRIDDLTSGFRAMRREAALHFLPLFPDGFSAPTTTTLSFLKAGYNVAFVPVHVAQRKGGESKIRPWQDGARFVTLILRMIMLYDPMRIFLPTGIGLAGLGTLAWIAGLWNAGRLVFPNSTIFLYSAALTTWLLGLVSDQIASNRVHYHGDETLVLLDEDD